MKVKFFLASFLNAAVASAAIINVTNTNDTGPGSLRAAFSTAQSGDVIDITATGTIDLASALPIIQGFSIQGPGTDQLTINGGGAINGFYVYSGTSSISNLTLADFTSKGGDGGSGHGGGGGALGAGAGVFVDAGTNVTIQNIAFIQNSAKGGNGGAFVSPTVGGGGGGGLNYSDGGNGGTRAGGGGGGLNNSNGGSASYGSGGGGGGVSFSDGGSSTAVGAGGGGGGGFIASAGGNTSGGNGGGGGGGLNGFNGGNVSGGTGGGGGGGTTGIGAGVTSGTTGGAGGSPNPQMNGEGGGDGGSVGSGSGVGNSGGSFAGGGGGGSGTTGNSSDGGSSPMLGGGGGGGTNGASFSSGGAANQGGGGGGGETGPGGNGSGGSSITAGGGGGGGSSGLEANGGNANNGGGGGGAFADISIGGSSTFAGGGGGASAGTITPGTGGFGGGNGGAGTEGGAGSGLGGAVFVREGGSLTVIDCQFSGDSTATGTGLGTPVSDGKDIYLMKDTTTTFTVSNAATVTPIFIAGGIGESALGGTLIKQGAGTLLIETQGIGSYDGDITVDAGTLNAAGQINSVAQVNPGGTLIGTGYLNTINNDGVVQPGNNSIGTLSAGTYTQAGGGTLRNEINPSGATDLLQVTNTATLGGTLQVIPDPGIYFSGQTFTFLTAGGGVSGTFSSLTSTSPSLLYQVLYFPTFAEIKILSGGIRPDCPAFGGNSGAVRNYLNHLPISSTSSTGKALLNLGNISCSDFKKALGELDPTRYIDFDWANASTLTLIRRNIEQRGRPSPCACECDEASCGGTWVATEGGHVQLSRLNSLPAFHANERIYLGGIDRRINSGVLVGLGGGFSRTHLHWTHIGGRGKIEGYHIIPYLNYSTCGLVFDGSIIASTYRLKGRRPMNFGSFHQSARTTHNGNSVLVHGGMTYNLPWKEYVFSPLASVDYIYLHRRRFKEHDGDGLGLKVDGHTTQFLEGRLGAAASRCFELCGGRLIPTLQGSVVSLSPISGYYQEAGIRGFSRKFKVRNTHKTLIQGAPLAQLTYELHDRVSISALYEGFFARKWQEHSYSATLAWNF